MRMRSALTEARQAFGWSGKNMRRHLAEACRWRHAEEGGEEEGEPQAFTYDGWEADLPYHRRYIQDFIDNAHWQNHSGTRNPDAHPIMLQRANGSGYHRQAGNWVDRAGAARWFITRRGVNWRRYVRARPCTGTSLPRSGLRIFVGCEIAHCSNFVFLVQKVESSK